MIARQRHHRRCLRNHAGPLARTHRHHGGLRRQGHLLREAPLHGCGGPGYGREPSAMHRLPAVLWQIGRAVSLPLRVGPATGRIGKLQRVVSTIGRQRQGGTGTRLEADAGPRLGRLRHVAGAALLPHHKDRCPDHVPLRPRLLGRPDHESGRPRRHRHHPVGPTAPTTPVPSEFGYLGNEWPTENGLFTTATKGGFCARYALQRRQVHAARPTRTESLAARRDRRLDRRAQELDQLAPESLEDQRYLSRDEIHLYKSNDYHPQFPLLHQEPPAYGKPPVEIGHRSTSICHLGNIAMRLGRELHRDPAAERFDRQRGSQPDARQAATAWTSGGVVNSESWSRAVAEQKRR